MKSTKRFLTSALLAASVTIVSNTVLASGNPKNGADVFAEECGDCHSTKEGKSKKGPPLRGVIGRKAGSFADFSGYSDSMKQSGIVWNEERIDAYISAPKKVVPGGKMKYDGLPDATSRADVIAYVMSLK